MEVFVGIALGLSTLLFVGPVFFYLIKSSLEHSVKAGIMTALGIVCGDAIYAGLLYKGFLPLLQDPSHQYWMAIIGAIVLLVLGIIYLTSSGNRKKEAVAKSSTPWYYFFANGFALNFINPFVVAVWIGFFSIIQSNTTSNTEVIVALYTILAVIFTTDCIKVKFASKLKRFFTPLRFKRMRQLLGVIMILFCIRLLITVLL